ncbi:MAG: site-2 protease family protein [Bryobacteraceae bacterium]|nr:site-2 protease family protein [Bryobacteraceae bacterium]
MSAFRVFGVPVRFHFTFVLLLIFLIVVGLEGSQSALADVLFVSGLFVSVLLHELGHAVVARRYGVRTIEIVMFPIGGIARFEKAPKARHELWIASAGPLVNIAIAAVVFVSLGLTSGLKLEGIATLTDPKDSNLLERLALGNLILAAFNLLPAFPMDGGRILRSLLAIWKPEEEATQIAARAGRMLAILMGLYGLISMHFLLVFIAFFVYLGAAQESQAALGRTLTQGIPLRAAMISRYHTLSHGQTVADAARLTLETSQQDFPVVHGELVVGLLDRHALMKAMATAGGEAYIAGVMERNFPRLDPNMDLTEALTAMANTGPCALVMEGDRLVGLMTRENLSEFLLLRRFGMPAATAQAVE